MASEYVTFDDLVRFHREVILPDLDRMLDAKLDEKLDAKFDERLSPLARAIVSLETRMEEGFNRLHDQIVDTRREMHAGFDDLYARFDELSVDYVSMKGGLKRVEKRTDVLETRVTRLEKKLP